jgi:outer membrane lipoprotein-sorting protein
MQRTRTAMAWLITLCMCAAGWAETGPEVLQRALDRCEQAQRAFRDRTIVQTGTALTATGDTLRQTLITYERTGWTRTDVTPVLPAGAQMNGLPIGVLTVTSLSDGVNTWVYMPGHDTQSSAGHADPSPADCWWLQSAGASVTGSDVLDGRDCWIVESITQEGDTNRCWVDARTHDVVRVEKHERMGSVTRWEPSDFRPVPGSSSYPYTLDIVSDGTVIASLQVSRISRNTGLSDTLFDAARIEANQRHLAELLKQTNPQR